MPDKQSKMTEEEKKWKAEDDLKTLQRADEVRKDPKRMKACMKIAEDQKKALEHTMANMPMSKMKGKMMKDYG